jgi:hypothetical protein
MLLRWVDVPNIIISYRLLLPYIPIRISSFPTNWLCPNSFCSHHSCFRSAKNCESENRRDVFPTVPVYFHPIEGIMDAGKDGGCVNVDVSQDMWWLPLTWGRVKPWPVAHSCVCLRLPPATASSTSVSFTSVPTVAPRLPSMSAPPPTPKP